MPNLWYTFTLYLRFDFLTLFVSPRHMMRDEEIYPDPDKYNPERFMQAPQNEDWCDPRHVVFGFGRR